jgi:hypothetical protein
MTRRTILGRAATESATVLFGLVSVGVTPVPHLVVFSVGRERHSTHLAKIQKQASYHACVHALVGMRAKRQVLPGSKH